MVAELPAALAPLVDGLHAGDLDRLVWSRPGLGARAAAVLALFDSDLDAIGPEQFRLTFVERATTLRAHAGQIAFPGGAADPGDLDAAATATREAEEEIGLAPSRVQVLGVLPAAHVSVSGFDVSTVVGWVRAPVQARVVDVAEVAAVFSVSIADLIDPGNRVTAVHPAGYRGPAFRVADRFIWGLTAHLCDAVLGLTGWAQPWPTDQLADVPTKFLTDRRHAPRGWTRRPDAH